MIDYDLIVTETKKKILSIRYCPSEPKQRAMLATLRNSSPESVAYQTVAFSAMDLQIQKDAMARQAIATALTLYSLHQQGKDAKMESVYWSNVSIGWATGRLVLPSKENETSVTRRFNQYATADSVEMVGEHLHGLIRQMRNADIGLDYAKLAGDLYLYQDAEKQSDVRLGWGMDYYRAVAYYGRAQ